VSALREPVTTTAPAPQTEAGTPFDLVRSLRPRQWLKNGFVAAPLLFSRQFDDAGQVALVAGAVACFCALSSAVYLVNDVIDRDQDREHPEKSARPIAAGLVSVRTALLTAALLGLGALACGFALDVYFGLVLALYGGLTMLYSLYLKYHVILDVMSIAMGFVLRVVAGAVVIRVEPSSWILICAGLLALLLAFAKRRHEVFVVGGTGRHREVLEQYGPRFLDAMITVTATATISADAVYTATGEPATHHLVVTFPFVLFGILRYLWLVFHEEQGGNPTDLLLADRQLLVAVVLWAAAAAIALKVSG